MTKRKRNETMKRFYRFEESPRWDFFKKPFKVDINDEEYTCFTQGYSIAFTTEDTGEIELYDSINDRMQPERFFDDKRMGYSGTFTFNADINAVIKELKNRGYKWNNRNKEGGRYFIKVNKDYYNAGLFEVTYNIINDGEEAIINYKVTDGKNPFGILYIESKIGKCIMLPIAREFTKGIEDRISAEHFVELCGKDGISWRCYND